MADLLSRRASFVCRSCQKLAPSQPTRRRLISQVANLPKQEVAAKSPRTVAIPLRKRFAQPTETPLPQRPTSTRLAKPTITRRAPAAASLQNADPAQQIQEFENFVAQVEATDAAADHDDVIEKLMDMYEFSNVLVHGSSKIPSEVAEQPTTSASQGDALFDDLSESKPTPSTTQSTTRQQMTLSFRQKASKTLTDLSYTLLRSPKVYITEPMLQIYVRILCQLGSPEYLPEIFHLYATKPIPTPQTTPITYSNPWPRMPKYAIPTTLAEAALECAILKKNLSLALAVIDTTVAAPAYRSSKILRQASIPGSLVLATPLIAYAGADWISHYQNTMDPSIAKATAIAGAFAYIGTLSTIGFVAITTWNDQMQRVVWRPGTHLSDRWLREDERRFFDLVAVAWGFSEQKRWGEEGGPEWGRLRDVLGGRDMVLDKTDLMDGMQ